MENILSLLQSALALLTLAASITTPGTEGLKQQAVTLANEAIAVATVQLQATPPPESPKKPATYLPPSYTQSAPPLQPISEPLSTTQTIIEPIKMNELTIIEPIKGKGNREVFIAKPQVVDESNYIELGLVIKDPDGVYRRDITVDVTATDEAQNKTMTGAGHLTKIMSGGSQITVYYYPFHYEFKTAGAHTITFTSLGQSVSQTFNVQEAAQ